MRFTATIVTIGLTNVLGERTWLSRFPAFPDSRSLEVVHFLTVDTRDEFHTKLKLDKMLLSKKVPQSATDRLKVPLGNELQLAIIHHDELSELANESAFCCTQEMFDAKKCSKLRGLSIPNVITYEFDYLSGTGRISGDSQKLPKTGLYYVTLSNCGNTDFGRSLSLEGELVAWSKQGYLPAEESPKFSVYFFLTLGYIILLIIWSLWCSAWKEVLFKIHHYITATILVGLFEALSWYISLYHWNYLGHRWWSMMALACFGTVCKQGVSYALLLLACLGLGVTKPRLESKQVVQCVLLCMAFIIADGVRQMALLVQDRVNGVAGTWKVILLVTPGSFFVSVLYVWILQALQDTIKELNDKRQVVKVEVYQKLRLALCLVMGMVITLVSYETVVVRRTELAENWQSRWIFTDMMSHSCFFFILLVIMYLWKPSERSLQMAYSEQIPIGEGGMELGEGIGGMEMGQGIGRPAENFDSVEIELGDDDEESEYQKSMSEAKKQVPSVLE